MRIDIYVFSKSNGKATAASFFKSFDRPYALSETIQEFPFSSYNGLEIMGRVRDVKTENGFTQLFELESEMAEDDLRDCLLKQGWKEISSPALE